MFEQTFKNIDDILHKDAGCGSELDYVEQTSWVLFLKYLDDLEKTKPQQQNLQQNIHLLLPKITNGQFGQRPKTKMANLTTTKPYRR
nr:type I restriction-modification system subunit M N-terminal domain-containing protein [Candidatus Brachybacter algidus]